MTVAALVLQTPGGERRAALADYLDAAADEQAIQDAHAWIKALRHVDADGQPFRRRFTYKDDSLWWFAELYLHKQQAVLELFRTHAALNRLLEREQPQGLRLVSGGRIVQGLAPQIAAERGIACAGAAGFGTGRTRLAKLDLRARGLTMSALASRLRPRGVPRSASRPNVAAFVHRAFWQTGSDEGSAESYIGPVLQALEGLLPRGDVRYVSIGPSENFRARRWWHALRPPGQTATVFPVEAFAPLSALRSSRLVWRNRYATLRALWRSEELRRHAVIKGCDCWPIIREELAGIALLQWPWSARAMDEAGAALDALKPRVALTYAEAGGWGRALMLEARRRGIRSVGLQHGFIYRHWLNYRHEPDEMAPDANRSADVGFPRPTLTLLFDEYAARHLEEAGRFPRAALAVSGSSRLDALVAAVAAFGPDEVRRARSQAGAQASQALVLLVTKYREARHVLPALAGAIAGMPDVHLAIKTHPAETPDVYGEVTRGLTNVRVLPAAEPLAPLLAASRAIVTMNSTVALDAAVLGVPALVIGLPNNLSPLVEAGALAGAAGPDIAPALRQILYDERFRLQLERDRNAFLARFAIGSDGRAAARSAEAIAALVAGHEAEGL